MKDTRDSEPVPCRDIDPAELFEQGLAPEAYHDLQEVTREVISDRSCCKIAVIEEECSRCSARISGLQILGGAPELMQNLKEMINDVYEAFYDDPRSVQHVDMDQHMAELGQEALTELFKSLQLAAGRGCKDAKDGTGKRAKQEVWAQILGPEFVDAD
ncbi:hypothetical protein [Halobacteriaceae bacterium SHR40]|uniref:hypothetical protein n=1 Tax=Halovenus amylolytica TaxID=2500550 RepID=UPI000FE3EA18